MSARRTTRAGFATVIVLTAIAMATLILVRLQASAYRQSSAGREAVAATRARWAARGGLEAVIARLAHENRGVEPVSAFSVFNAMDAVSSGEFEGARFDISHTVDGVQQVGPADAHAKININLMNPQDLLELPGMTEDVAAAIIDWIDTDDLTSEFGAEAGYYNQLIPSYEPRNGPIRSLRELELVVGVDPELVRGEDWNLNGRLDPNENDGDRTWPDDDEDGRLDAGWSEFITASSQDVGLAASGLPRINLLNTDQRTLINRCGPLDAIQARVLLEWAALNGERIEQIIGTTLQQMAQQVPTLGVPPQNIENLNEEQTRAILANCEIRDESQPAPPGRLNLNTVRRKTLDYVTSIPPGLSDLIIFTRNSRPDGFTSMLDLQTVPGLAGNTNAIVQLSSIVTVEPNTFVVSSVGRDVNSGIEVEILATIERSALPIIITELSER
ncbi:MAG: hypothetical protein Tsb0013_00270 [Phycisphaerales bacterium]